MAYVVIIVGIFLTVAGVRGTQNDLFTLVKGDFTGQTSFIYWLFAIAVVGALGYIPQLKGLSNAFLLLILVVLVLHNGTGFFSQLQSGLQSTTQPSPQAQTGTGK